MSLYDYDCIHKAWQDFYQRKLRLCPNNNKVTANLNIQLEHPVLSKTDNRELHNIHEKAAISKTLITDTNAKTEKKAVFFL